MKKINFLILCFLLSFSSSLLADISKNDTDWMKDKYFREAFFMREYTPIHLNANPQQTVRKIIVHVLYLPVRAKVAREYFGLNNEYLDKAIVNIYLKYKNLPDWYMQGGTCTKKSDIDEYSCYIDSDGGNFSVKTNASKQLFLTGNARMEMCGVVWEEVSSQLKNSTGSLMDSAGGSEVFILKKSSNPKLKRMLTKCGGFL